MSRGLLARKCASLERELYNDGPPLPSRPADPLPRAPGVRGRSLAGSASRTASLAAGTAEVARAPIFENTRLVSLPTPGGVLSDLKRPIPDFMISMISAFSKLAPDGDRGDKDESDGGLSDSGDELQVQARNSLFYEFQGFDFSSRPFYALRPFNIPFPVFHAGVDALDTMCSLGASQVEPAGLIPLSDVVNFGLPPEVIKSLPFKSIFPWQYDMLSRTVPADDAPVFQHTLLSAPTSAGKSLIANIFMLRCLALSKRSVIFAVPFIALADEISSKFQAIVPSGCSVVCITGMKQVPKISGTRPVLYVCTFEKSIQVFRKFVSKDVLPQLGLIVFDEIHQIGEPGMRAARLELFISQLILLERKYPTKAMYKILGMSATLSNMPDFQQWLGCYLYECTFRPVKLEEYVIFGNQFYRFDEGGDDSTGFDVKLEDGEKEFNPQIPGAESAGGLESAVISVAKDSPADFTPSGARNPSETLNSEEIDESRKGASDLSQRDKTESPEPQLSVPPGQALEQPVRSGTPPAVEIQGSPAKRTGVCVLQGDLVVKPPNCSAPIKLPQLYATAFLAPKPLIIFAATKTETQTIAITFARRIAETLPRPNDELLGKRLQLFKSVSASSSEKARQPGGVLQTMILNGVMYHNSSLSSKERGAIEEGFRSGILHTVVATTTISAGVNLPAQAVIISSTKIGTTDLDGVRYRQMIGRAGRMGLSNKGLSFLVIDEKEKRVSSVIQQPPGLNGDRQSVVASQAQRRRVERALADIINDLHELKPTLSALTNGSVTGEIILNSCIYDVRVEDYLASTLAYVQKRLDNESILNSISQLQRSGLISFSPEGIISLTRKGVATVESGCDIVMSSVICYMIDSIETRGLVLGNDLHACCALVPMSAAIQRALSDLERRASEAVGAVEAPEGASEAATAAGPSNPAAASASSPLSTQTIQEAAQGAIMAQLSPSPGSQPAFQADMITAAWAECPDLHETGLLRPNYDIMYSILAGENRVAVEQVMSRFGLSFRDIELRITNPPRAHSLGFVILFNAIIALKTLQLTEKPRSLDSLFFELGSLFHIDSGLTESLLKNVVQQANLFSSFAEHYEKPVLSKIFKIYADRFRQITHDDVSDLLLIPGVGEARARVLRDAGFKNADDIVEAGVDALKKVLDFGDMTESVCQAICSGALRVIETYQDL